MRTLAIILCLCLAGCGGSDGSSDDAGTHDGKTTDKAFGEACSEDLECQTGTCWEFGVGDMCTFACEEDSECPEGSEGQKCNKQGYCRP